MPRTTGTVNRFMSRVREGRPRRVGRPFKPVGITFAHNRGSVAGIKLSVQLVHLGRLTVTEIVGAIRVAEENRSKLGDGGPGYRWCPGDVSSGKFKRNELYKMGCTNRWSGSGSVQLTQVKSAAGVKEGLKG